MYDKTVIKRGCKNCHGTTASITRTGGKWHLQGTDKKFTTLSDRDAQYVMDILYEHFHDED